MIATQVNKSIHGFTLADTLYIEHNGDITKLVRREGVLVKKLVKAFPIANSTRVKLRVLNAENKLSSKIFNYSDLISQSENGLVLASIKLPVQLGLFH